MPTFPPLRGRVNMAPHVLILGAGASIAAHKNWGEVGNRPPCMQDFAAVLGIESELSAAGFDAQGMNFEDIYESIAIRPDCIQLRVDIENRVHEYFSHLSLPSSPTIYDYLVLSLRSKDLIATFNWDPFLMHAYFRSESAAPRSRPRLAFLHGNVMVGACLDDRISGVNGQTCRKCGKMFSPSRLLYPIRQKDYQQDSLISNEWNVLQSYLRRAYLLTVFGYSAPKTDVEARELMLDTWRANTTLDLAQVDVIDIKSHDEVRESWREFFVRDHYGVYDDVFDTRLFRYPRRSCDAFAGATLMLEPWAENPFPRVRRLEALHEWVQPLVLEERAFDEHGTDFSGQPCPMGGG